MDLQKLVHLDRLVFVELFQFLHDVLAQIENGNTSIVGFMLESYLEWGTQPIRLDHSKMDYGVSVTDPCIDWPTTEALLREAAERFQKVREEMGL